MNKLTVSEVNDNFITDLSSNYIMECFKYKYTDILGSTSTYLDIDTDSPEHGIIGFSITTRDAINFKSISLYYKNPLGQLTLAFSLDNLENLFEFNEQVMNRLFINLYDFTDIINCKFKFFNSQSYVFRQMHKNNFFPFFIDSESLKFSDTLSFTNTFITDQNSNNVLDLIPYSKIKSDKIKISYDNKFFKNNNINPVQITSIFDKSQLDLIPDIEYTIKNEYNNEEYIIMSSFNIPILGGNIPELNYEDSRTQYLLLSSGLEGGLNPTRELRAIAVDNFVNQFKNVITIWDTTTNYVVGDTVKSSTNNKLYVCVENNINQNPVYRNPDQSLVNRDAGKYWSSYPNTDIGTRKLIEATNNSINNLFQKLYCDDHILHGSNNLGVNSFPDTWSKSISLLGDAFKTVTGDIGSGNETRYAPISKDNTKGRYPRMINRDGSDGSGLTIRDSEVISHRHYMKHDHVYRQVNSTVSIVAGGGATGYDYRDSRTSFSRDYTDNTGGSRNRGDEIDYYTVIKVR